MLEYTSIVLSRSLILCLSLYKEFCSQLYQLSIGIVAFYLFEERDKFNLQ